MAKSFAHREAAAGNKIIVFDPLRSVGWPAGAIKYSVPERFMDDLADFQNAYVYIDEAKVLWDANKKCADKILYQYRHKGMLITLIAQRTRMVPPNGRNQCDKIYAFRQQSDDAKILADEYHPSMIEATSLPKITFLATNGFDHGKYVLDFKDKIPGVKKVEEKA